MPKRFVVVGLGFVADRHLRAIHETDNELVAACDPYDGVGKLDRYFPGAAYFPVFERLDRHVDNRLRRKQPVDWVSVCSPNHLHDAHCRWALRFGAHVLCEKPVVLNERNLDGLCESESRYKGRVNVVLQMRLHPAMATLRDRMLLGHHVVDLRYVTPRGKWYDYSWKGDPTKSGGLATNIGVHLFDMLIWMFGNVQESEVTKAGIRRLEGRLELERATVTWLLSINQEDAAPGTTRNRIMTVDGETVDFTLGFEDLHTRVYEGALAGRGFTLEDARPAIALTEQIRSQLR